SLASIRSDCRRRPRCGGNHRPGDVDAGRRSTRSAARIDYGGKTVTANSEGMQEMVGGLSQDKAKLVELLLARQAARAQRIPAFARPEHDAPAQFPASWAQQRLWFFDQLAGGGWAYNVPIALTLEGALDTDALRAALDALVQRHEVLRTVFVNVAGQPQQRIC